MHGLCFIARHEVGSGSTRQVAPLTRSNLLLNSGGFLQLRSAPPSGRLHGNDQRSGRLSWCAGFPPALLSV